MTAPFIADVISGRSLDEVHFLALAILAWLMLFTAFLVWRVIRRQITSPTRPQHRRAAARFIQHELYDEYLDRMPR